MQNHAILHSDLNCFYASVETMLDPSLNDSTNKRRAIG